MSAKSLPLPTVWADTNIVIDFYSKISLQKNHRAGAHAVEETRKLMQEAAWLAIVFDDQSTTTVSFRHEVWESNIREKAAPEKPEGTWTAMVAHVVTDYVCPRWIARQELDGATTTNPDGTLRATDNDERDQIMVDLAKAQGLTIVSRDKKARRRARDAGLKDVFTPAEYAARFVPFEVARKRFLGRLEVGIAAWLLGRRGRAARDAADHIREEYKAIWEPVAKRSRTK